MKPIALVTTLHDPDGRQAPLAEPLLPAIEETFEGVVVSATPGSVRCTVELLKRAGAFVLQDGVPEGWGTIGLARRQALEVAVRLGHRHVLLCDFDRLLHWLTVAPDELPAVAERVHAADFVVLGRTPSAFDSHPAVQRETERLANHVFALVTGQPWDITGGARGLSSAGLEAVVSHSRVASLGVDAEWPILLQRLGLRVEYMETEGLSFETADRYADLIERCGGYGAWLTRHVNTAAAWSHRLGIAHEIARAAVEAAARKLTSAPVTGSPAVSRPPDYP